MLRIGLDFDVQIIVAEQVGLSTVAFAIANVASRIAICVAIAVRMTARRQWHSAIEKFCRISNNCGTPMGEGGISGDDDDDDESESPYGDSSESGCGCATIGKERDLAKTVLSIFYEMISPF